MSQLVDTELGQFRCVTDGSRKWFLFECPHCGEMLPLTEGHFRGDDLIDHESRKEAARYCTFQGRHKFGEALIPKMQAMILMGYQPCHDEGESEWMPSRSSGADGVL